MVSLEFARLPKRPGKQTDFYLMVDGLPMIDGKTGDYMVVPKLDAYRAVNGAFIGAMWLYHVQAAMMKSDQLKDITPRR